MQSQDINKAIAHVDTICNAYFAYLDEFQTALFSLSGAVLKEAKTDAQTRLRSIALTHGVIINSYLQSISDPPEDIKNAIELCTAFQMSPLYNFRQLHLIRGAVWHYSQVHHCA